MKSLSKHLIRRMVVSTAIGIVSLGSASHAMANSHHHVRTPAVQAPYRYQAPLDVAAIPPYPNSSSKASPAPYARAGYDSAARPAYPQWAGAPQWAFGFPFAGAGVDVRQLLAAALGGAVPLHYSGRSSAGDSAYVDTSPPADDAAAAANGWAIQQSANDAAAAAIQQEDANLDAMNASNAAAAAQNAAAEDMTNQYMMNQVNSQ